MLNEEVVLPIPLPAWSEEKLGSLLPREGLVEHGSVSKFSREGRKGCSFQTRIGEDRTIQRTFFQPMFKHTGHLAPLGDFGGFFC